MPNIFKHEPGDACCCCGPLEAPALTALVSPAGESKPASAWTLDDCCKSVTLFPSGTAFTYVCSDAARVQEINESFQYLVYLRTLQRVTGSSAPSLDCQIDRFGNQTCTTVDSNGNPITCDETLELCATLTQTAFQRRTLRAAAKYRYTKFEATIFRADVDCGSGVACKYVLVVRAFVELYAGNIIQQRLQRTTTGQTACCVTTVNYDADIDETCRVAIDRTLLPSYELILRRAKVFDSMPSGPITLGPNDVYGCSPVSTCVIPLGDSSVTVQSGNVGIWSTHAGPNVTNQEITVVCQGLYDFGGLECYRFPIGNATRIRGVVDANILASLHFSVAYICNPANGLDFNAETEACNQKELWDLVATNLTSSVTDTGYTPKAIEILNDDWTISL